VLSIDFDVGNVVFEHGGDVDLEKVRLRREKGRMLRTSGKVPFEKTIKRQV